MRGLGQLFVGIFLEVVNGDGQAPAAAIALPGAEFLGSFEIGDLVPSGENVVRLARGTGAALRTALRRTRNNLCSGSGALKRSERKRIFLPSESSRGRCRSKDETSGAWARRLRRR